MIPDVMAVARNAHNQEKLIATDAAGHVVFRLVQTVRSVSIGTIVQVVTRRPTPKSAGAVFRDRLDLLVGQKQKGEKHDTDRRTEKRV
jgi:hypothetical protein